MNSCDFNTKLSSQSQQFSTELHQVRVSPSDWLRSPHAKRLSRAAPKQTVNTQDQNWLRPLAWRTIFNLSLYLRLSCREIESLIFVFDTFFLIGSSKNIHCLHQEDRNRENSHCQWSFPRSRLKRWVSQLQKKSINIWIDYSQFISYWRIISRKIQKFLLLLFVVFPLDTSRIYFMGKYDRSQLADNWQR